MKKYIVFALILAPLAIFAAANSYNINFNSTVVSGTSVLSTTVRYTFTTNIPDAARYTISISCLPSTQGSLNASFGEKYIRGEEACRSSDMPINYDYLDVTYYGGGTTNAVLKVYSATGELLGTSGSIIIDVSAAMTGSQIDGSKQILIKTESSDLVTPTPAPATAPAVDLGKDATIQQLQKLLIQLIQQLIELMSKQGTTLNTPPPATVTATGASCSNLGCVIAAARICAPINVTIPYSIQLGNVTATGTNSYQLSLGGYGRCNLLQIAKDASGAGTTMNCNSDPATIVSYLTDLNNKRDTDTSVTNENGATIQTFNNSDGSKLVCNNSQSTQ